MVCIWVFIVKSFQLCCMLDNFHSKMLEKKLVGIRTKNEPQVPFSGCPLPPWLIKVAECALCREWCVPVKHYLFRDSARKSCAKVVKFDSKLRHLLAEYRFLCQIRIPFYGKDMMINWDDTFKTAQSLLRNTHWISHKYCCIVSSFSDVWESCHFGIILCMANQASDPPGLHALSSLLLLSSRGLLSAPQDISSRCWVHGSSRMPGQCPATHLESFFALLSVLPHNTSLRRKSGWFFGQNITHAHLFFSTSL